MGDITKKKLVAALGMNMPSVHDIVKRENYKTEEEYLSALVETSSKLNNPEVKAALREAKRASCSAFPYMISLQLTHRR